MNPLIVIDGRKLDDFGIGRYLSSLLVELARRDDPWSYAVICRPARSSWVEALGPRFRALPSELRLYSLSELRWSRAAFGPARPDLFHAPHYVLPFGLTCPAVVTMHDPIHLLYPSWWSRPGRYLYARWMMASAARRARRVITVSQAAAADLKACLGRADLAVEVIPNGVALEPGARALPVAPPAAGYFLFVGNPLPHKNLAGLLAAYAAYRERAPEPRELWLAGCVVEPAPAGVRALGRVSDHELAALYRAAHAAVVPSLYEGFGLVLLEALAAGTPALASDRPALRELAGDAALFVDPLDRDALRAGLERLDRDQALRERLRQAGPARACGFSWQRSAAAHARVYAEILGP